jgi:DNA-binding MarR family transcriptional regulator
MSRRATPRSRSTEALADALHSAAIRLLRRLRRTDDETGLSPARLSALSVIVFGGPLRITDLARAEQVRTPTITPIVASLEGAGLVTREVDQGDGRASVLRATAAGRDVMARGRARRVEALTAELRRLPAADRDILRRAADLMQRVARGASG